jgi:hypothetical protein
MQRIHETATPPATGLIALARNPLRLSAMTFDDKTPRAEPAIAAPLRWLLRRVRAAFLSAGSPTSVPRADDADQNVGSETMKRPGGSMLRRME